MLSRYVERLCAVALGGLALAGAPAAARAGSQDIGAASAAAPLTMVSQSATIDVPQGMADFDLQFNRAPDFYTIDAYGRPADSFQYEIDPNWSGNTTNLQLGWGQFTEVIRGDEIHSAGALVIRSATPAANPQPGSGGWGAVLAKAPLHVAGDDVSFAVPLSALGARAGKFSYDVFTTSYGVTESEVTGKAVPLPPVAWTAPGLLAAVVLVSRRRRAMQG